MTKSNRTFQYIYDAAKRLYSTALDALFPIFCFGCGQEGRALCAACMRKIGFLTFDDIAADSNALCAVRYQNPVISQMVQSFKYEGLKSLDQPIAEIMVEYLRINNFDFQRGAGNHPGDWVVSFVPMHWQKQQVRDYNQAELIARRLAELLGLPCAKLLRKNFKTKPQMLLSRENRRKNLLGAFSALADKSREYKCAGLRVLLVDDVCTTGSTLAECRKTLLAASASEVLCFAFARD